MPSPDQHDLPPLENDLPDNARAGNRAGNEDDERINNILGEEDVGSTIEISRKSPENGWGFVSSLNVSDWSDDTKRVLAREFGGGEYRARIRRPNKTFGPTFKFMIDRSVRPAPVPAPDNTNPMDMLRQAKALTGDSTALMMQMMQQAQATQMQFMQMMQAQQAKSMEMMVSMMTRPVTPAPEQSGKLVEILLAHTLRAPAPAPSLDLEKMVSAMVQLRQLAGGDSHHEQQAAPEDKSDFIGDILKALPSVLKTLSMVSMRGQPQLMEAQAATPAPVAPNPAADAAPSPAASAPASPLPPAASEPSDAGANKAALAKFLPQLVEYAAEQEDPVQVADQVVQILDPEQLAGIRQLLNRADWLAVLADAHQPIMVHSNWFIKLRAELIGGAIKTVDTSPGSIPV